MAQSSFHPSKSSSGASFAGKTLSPVQKLLLAIEDEMSRRNPRSDEAAINQLPDSVIVKILSYSNPVMPHVYCGHNNIMRNVRMTCKKWFLLCRDREIWKSYVGKKPLMNTYVCKDEEQCMSVWMRYAIGIRHLKSRDLSVGKLCSLVKSAADLETLLFSMSTVQYEFEYVELLKAVEQFCPNLHTLEIVMWTFITPDKCQAFKHVKNLKTLKFTQSDFEDSSLSVILENVDKLETLQFHYSLLPENIVSVIASKGKIKALCIVGTRRPLDAGSAYKELVFDAEIQSLEKLVVRFHQAGNLVRRLCLFGIAEHCKRVQVLDISGNNYLCIEGILRVMENLKNLQTLILDKTNVNDKCVGYICRFGHQLKVLSVYDCSRITDLGYDLIFSNEAAFFLTLKELYIYPITRLDEYMNMRPHGYSVIYCRYHMYER